MTITHRLLFFTLTLVIAQFSIILAQAKETHVHVVSAKANDLYQYLEQHKIENQHYGDASKALAACKKGDSLLILATEYPEKKTTIPKNLFAEAKAKNLKVYIEFPDRVSDGETKKVKKTKLDRCVVTSDFFGKDLPEMSLLDAGMYSYVTVADCDSLIRGAKVAGLNKAVYGLKDTPSAPLLFIDNGVLVCTSQFSRFRQARYSASKSWGVALSKILNHLNITKSTEPLIWKSAVTASYSKNAELPKNADITAIKRGADWYKKGRFLIHSDWKDHWYKHSTKRVPVGEPMDLSLPSGDGSLGVLEGHYSQIKPDGSQTVRYWLRADCVAEVAMTMALAGEYETSPENAKIAENLMNMLFYTDTFKTSASKIPSKTSYGLMGWAHTHKGRYYRDDNARVIIGSILAAQKLENSKWDDEILKLIIANFRTTGVNGFSRNAIEEQVINRKNWKQLSADKFINPHPHHQSWLLATYLWLYDKTKQPELLEKAKNGIRITMERYPNWKWTNGIQQERARMILPLAWLVRVEDTPQHREWLDLIVGELLKNQVACGAIREELGKAVVGRYGATKSNRRYGTTEAPVIYKNGDPVADMLYTTNFAFFALNEAAQATKNPKYLEANKKVAEFLVRIQSKTSGRADLDGCWFRAFNYDTWEVHGTNADHGWGPWGTLTGWTQSFITSTLVLSHENTSFWDMTKDSKIGKNMKSAWKEMHPETPVEKVKNAAIGKKITLNVKPSSKYPGMGANGLINGAAALSPLVYTHPEWLGFEGQDIEAVIDLG